MFFCHVFIMISLYDFFNLISANSVEDQVLKSSQNMVLSSYRKDVNQKFYKDHLQEK